MADLPELSPLKIIRTQHALDQAAANRLDALIVIAPDDAAPAKWPEFPYRAEIARLRKQSAGERVTAFSIAAERPVRIVAGFEKTGATAFERLSLARKLAAEVLRAHPATIGLYAAPAPDPDAAAEALVSALLAARFQLPSFKRKPAPAPGFKSIKLFHPRKLDLTRTQAAAAGNNLARWLTALPANHLTPKHYRELLRRLAAREGWTFEFLDEKALARRGTGAFLAVARGSSRRDAGIVRLSYRPSKQSRKPRLALVGKGICFDTGGTNLKSAKGMFGMHGDMQGSAVAAGTLLALSRLRANFPVDAWLALATNDIGPGAYRQNEVVRAANGATIEIVHTDAEGRMVLSDTLTLASRSKPALMLDYATLTGSCIDALGTRYTGAFTNEDILHETVIAAGRASGERVWPFPTDADFDEALESPVADTKQCTVGSEADHILAARFLGRFVEQGVPWVHLDLSAGESKDGLAHVPTDVTGFGVRFTLEFLRQYGSFGF